MSNDLRVEKIMPINVTTIRKVLSSTELTESQKLQFVRQNKNAIKSTLGLNINANEFQTMMANRPLQLFKPLKNAFTKRGDTILLAKALDLPVGRINDYINSVTEDIKTVNDINYLPKDKLDKIKTYIFRHGSKDQVVTFLDYELAKSNDVLKTLYSTLEYNNGGVADYFMRPVHRLDNKTLINVFRTCDKHILENEDKGNINIVEALNASKWALTQIYTIQNNQKFTNALKLQKDLS